MLSDAAVITVARSSRLRVIDHEIAVINVSMAMHTDDATFVVSGTALWYIYKW